MSGNQQGGGGDQATRRGECSEPPRAGVSDLFPTQRSARRACVGGGEREGGFPRSKTNFFQAWRPFFAMAGQGFFAMVKTMPRLDNNRKRAVQSWGPGLEGIGGGAQLSREDHRLWRG